MKIIKIGDPKIIMQNPTSKHNYFAWPTVTRLQNGRIAVVASGFRLSHVCPFGKAVISYSDDEGETYTYPAPIIDTRLDDRDAGILAFGESGVMVTSFNNSIEEQKKMAIEPYIDKDESLYRLAYLNTITKEEEEHDLGVTFRTSFDYGKTFGKIHKCPVSSPHGPIELRNGKILWVGWTNFKDYELPYGCISAHTVDPESGKTEYIGRVEDIVIDGEKQLSCEPYAFELEDGTIICHIRVQNYTPPKKRFTIFQTFSHDGGKTWTKPEQIISDFSGAPSHIMRHSSGVLIASYGHRVNPSGIKVMFSYDNGKTWDFDHDVYVTGDIYDLGYPSTVELSDKSLLTVFYACPELCAPAVVWQQKWKFDNEKG